MSWLRSQQNFKQEKDQEEVQEEEVSIQWSHCSMVSKMEEVPNHKVSKVVVVLQQVQNRVVHQVQASRFQIGADGLEDLEIETPLSWSSHEQLC